MIKIESENRHQLTDREQPERWFMFNDQDPDFRVELRGFEHSNRYLYMQEAYFTQDSDIERMLELALITEEGLTIDDEPYKVVRYHLHKEETIGNMTITPCVDKTIPYMLWNPGLSYEENRKENRI